MITSIVLFEQNKPDDAPIDNYPVLGQSDVQYGITKMLQRRYGHNGALPISFINGKIKTSYYVGTIKYRNIQIEILPKFLAHNNAPNRNKIAIENLMYMLNYTKRLDIKWNLGARLSDCPNLFQETLIKIFIESLFDSLKRFTPKNYVLTEDNLHFIRGKLKLSAHIRCNACNAARFYCEYDEFSEDNQLNQLFLYVSKLLYGITQNANNKKLLKFVIDYYSDITEKTFNIYNIQSIHLTRNQHIFKTPFMLAKMFLEHSATDMSAHRMENIALMWNMNELFEEFVFGFINHHKNYFGFDNVSYQKTKKLLVKTETNKSCCKATYVDIMITQSGSHHKIILDTKYKTPSSLTDISSADIYQVATYCALHGCAENVRAVLLYPSNENLDSDTYRLNADEDNGKYEIKTAWIDLTQPLNKQTDCLKESLFDILQ